MSAPQVCMIVWITATIVANIVNYDKKRYVSYSGRMLNTAIWFGLIYWGGFFD